MKKFMKGVIKMLNKNEELIDNIMKLQNQLNSRNEIIKNERILFKNKIDELYSEIDKLNEENYNLFNSLKVMKMDENKDLRIRGLKKQIESLQNGIKKRESTIRQLESRYDSLLDKILNIISKTKKIMRFAKDNDSLRLFNYISELYDINEIYNKRKK